MDTPFGVSLSRASTQNLCAFSLPSIVSRYTVSQMISQLDCRKVLEYFLVFGTFYLALPHQHNPNFLERPELSTPMWVGNFNQSPCLELFTVLCIYKEHDSFSRGVWNKVNRWNNACHAFAQFSNTDLDFHN